MEEKTISGEKENVVKRFDFPHENSLGGESTVAEDALIFTDRSVIKREKCGGVFTQKEVLLREIDRVDITSYPRHIKEMSGILSSFKSIEFIMGILMTLLFITSFILSLCYWDYWDWEIWASAIIFAAVAIVPMIIAIVTLCKRPLRWKGDFSAPNAITRARRDLLIAMMIVSYAFELTFSSIIDYWHDRIAIIIGVLAFVLSLLAAILMRKKYKASETEKTLLKVSFFRSNDVCVLRVEKEFDTSEEATAIADEIGAQVFRTPSDAAKWE